MTAKKKLRKVSRRQAITALSASLVGGGVVVSADGGQKKPPRAKSAPAKPVSARCGKVTSECVTTATPGETHLVASVCCDYTTKALNDCFMNLRDTDPVEAKMKGDLKDFLAELKKQALLDFCWIHFGIKAEKMDQFKQRMIQVANSM